LPIVEDAAQSIGARYSGRSVGSIGDVGCFSFFPSKNLGGAGDGGILTTNNPELAEKLKVLRVHGSRKKYHYETIGMNSRLDAIQAAILRVKLPHLDSWAAKRRRNASVYRDLLAPVEFAGNIELPIENAACEHVYNQFTIRAKRRDQLREFLTAEGIPTEIYYPSPLHREPAFACFTANPRLPLAEQAATEVLSLPIFPELTEPQLATVARAIGEFYGTVID
jgi:dTDP-4-amino-4,6-dideoxygalactose transaminase